MSYAHRKAKKARLKDRRKRGIAPFSPKWRRLFIAEIVSRPDED